MKFDVSGMFLKFIAWLLIVTLPIRPAGIAVMCLVFADLISGLLASKKIGKPITSSGLRRTVSKLLIYEIALVVAMMLEQYLLEGGLPVIKTVGAMIGVTEAKSFFENLHIITGVDFWAYVTSKVDLPNVKNDADKGE